MTARALAVSPDEADRAFATLAAYHRIIVAVSGGADSLALMHLLADWHERQLNRPAPIVVVTVDHQLRPGSAAEAERVAAAAATRGLSHVSARDTEQPPTTPFSQAWARTLRYRLLLPIALDRLETKRLPGGTLGSRPVYPKAAIVTAHHLDDQAETFVMRLARGSGLDGLGAMRSVRSLHDRVDLVRPLLAFSKVRLTETLRARGLDWVDDPSNADTRFERVRVRAQAGALLSAGIDAVALGRSARRLARADAALDVAVDDLFEQGGAGEKPICLSHAGYARIAWGLFLRVMPELRLRALSRLLVGLGDSLSPVSLGQLEDLTEERHWSRPHGLTLHGCRFVVNDDLVFLCPEEGRLADATVSPLADARWGPFWLSVSPDPMADALDPASAPDHWPKFVRPIGAANLAHLARLGHALPDWTRAVPRAVVEVQPGIYSRDNRLLAAPTLNVAHWSTTARLPLTLTAKLINDLIAETIQT
jgi:tRNA(Ile)-lysidine synthase